MSVREGQQVGPLSLRGAQDRLQRLCDGRKTGEDQVGSQQRQHPPAIRWPTGHVNHTP